MSEDKEFVSVGEIDEAEANRADNAARQSRWRARRDLEAEGLTVKKMLKLKATRSAALAATISAAQAAMQNLTPEMREIFDSELFQEGMSDGSSAGLRYLQAQMHDVIEGIKNGDQTIRNHGVEVRGDWVAEFYTDFVTTFSWAKALVYPRSYSAVQEGEAHTMAEFHSAVAKWLASTNHDSEFTLPEPEPRKRGRPRKNPLPVTAVDPAVLTFWRTPPTLKQADHWSQMSAARASKVIARDLQEAESSKHITVFTGDNNAECLRPNGEQRDRSTL
jgi:hypothetical protein